MSQKILPSAKSALSLLTCPLSKSQVAPRFFFFKLFLASACSKRTFSSSVSGERRFTGAAFRVFESRATNIKFAVTATESDASVPSAGYNTCVIHYHISHTNETMAKDYDYCYGFLGIKVVKTFQLIAVKQFEEKFLESEQNCQVAE